MFMDLSSTSLLLVIQIYYQNGPETYSLNRYEFILARSLFRELTNITVLLSDITKCTLLK